MAIRRSGTRITATPTYEEYFDWDKLWENMGAIVLGLFVLFLLAKCTGAA